MGDRFGDRFGGGGGRGGGRGGGFSRQAATKALKESVQTGHRTGLPQNILQLFSARPPVPLPEPIAKKPPRVRLAGVASCVKEFASEGDPEYQPPRLEDRPPSPRLFRNKEFPTQARIDTETKIEKKLRIAKWRKEAAEQECAEKARGYDPNKDPKIEGDPYKTILVGNLSYDVTDKKLRREFEEFGPIKRIRVVTDKNGKSRGYAFIEFEHKQDFKSAYKGGDGKKIEGRRVLVDCERGRTIDNWRPRRLGGGLGGAGREPRPPKKPQFGMPVMASTAAAPGLAPGDDREGGGFGPSRAEEVRPYVSEQQVVRRGAYARARSGSVGGRRDDMRDRERERSPVRRPDVREGRPEFPYTYRDGPSRDTPRDRPAFDARGAPDRDRDRAGERDRDRDFRKREPSPRRMDRVDDKRSRRDVGPEDGEVRDERERRERERDRDGRRRERDAI